MATNEGPEASDEFDYYPATAYEALNAALTQERRDFDEICKRAEGLERAMRKVRELTGDNTCGKTLILMESDQALRCYAPETGGDANAK
jgi:hypothetical protein